MPLKALNEERLWRSSIQRANYPVAVLKPQMHLPEINSLTGKPVHCDLHAAINESYAKYSENYWYGVALRNRLYRDSAAAAAAAAAEPAITRTNTPPAVSGVINRLAH